MSDRVTMPRTWPFERTRTAGFDLDSNFAIASTGCAASTIGNGGSITWLTVASSSFVSSRLLAESDQSLTEPTQLAPSMIGSCDTSCSDMSRNACLTVVPGATLTTGWSVGGFELNTLS